MVKLIKIIFYASLLACVIAMSSVIATYFYLKPNLPEISLVNESQLQLPLKIYTQDKVLIGEYGEIKRRPVAFNEIPNDLKNAFLAAEDDRFFIDKAIYPTYQGGFGFNSTWKNFTLDTQFSFVADIYRNNGSLGVIEDPTLTSLSNSSTSLLDAWQQPGDVTYIPALSTESIRNRLTDRYIEDASFLRLRNITLGYNLGNLLKEGSPISKMKVFVQAEKLITWSNWRGRDSESSFRSGDFFDYPTSNIFTIGLHVNY